MDDQRVCLINIKTQLQEISNYIEYPKGNAFILSPTRPLENALRQSDSAYIWITVFMSSGRKIQDGADLSGGFRQCNLTSFSIGLTKISTSKCLKWRGSVCRQCL